MKTKLSLVERTILANQYRILANFDDQELNIQKAEILENGYTGHYHMALLHDEEISEEVCEETSEILQMYRVINGAYGQLSAEEKEGLNMDAIAFEGFDGHESHYHYAAYMIENLNLWQEYNDMYLDSHTGASIRKYRRMYNVYLQRYGAPHYRLTRESLQEIIDAVAVNQA